MDWHMHSSGSVSYTQLEVYKRQAPKVAGNGGGSALMKDPQLAGRIVKAVSAAVPVPVTVKFRKGWDENSVNAVEFAQIMEENGAAALCIHGRTRQQMYAPCLLYTS